MTSDGPPGPFPFHMPTEVRFGPGVFHELAQTRKLGRRVAIVCGRHSARDSGALDRLLDAYPDALILEGVPENPDTAAVDARAALCRESGADWVIALGGGSALDSAKAIALLATNPGTCRDWLADTSACRAALPLVAIPTTAGTGSEVTQYSVLVDTESRKKITLRHPSLFPALALLDPELTRNLPASVARATALDALSQAMEGMLSRRATPVGNTLAVDACRRIRRSLPAVLEDPENSSARGDLLYAAMLSGMVIAQSGTTLAHGLGYYYTLEHGLAHGVANALLLPPLFAWNARFNPAAVADLAAALGHPATPDPAAAAGAIVAALHDLYDRVHFSAAARDHGIPRETGPRWAADILQEPHRFRNQVGEFSREDVTRLLDAAWRGGA